MDIDHIVNYVRDAQEESRAAQQAAMAADRAASSVLNTAADVHTELGDTLGKAQTLARDFVAEGIGRLEEARTGFSNTAIALSVLAGESNNQSLQEATRRALSAHTHAQTENVGDLQRVPDLIATLLASLAVAHETAETLQAIAYGGTTDLTSAMHQAMYSRRQADHYVNDLQ